MEAPGPFTSLQDSKPEAINASIKDLPYFLASEEVINILEVAVDYYKLNQEVIPFAAAISNAVFLLEHSTWQLLYSY